MTLNVCNVHYPNWTQVHAPNPQRPYWHEEDGARAHVHQLLAGLDERSAEQVIDMHARAVGALLAAATRHHVAGEAAAARRLAMACGRLCEEVAGLWPPSALTIDR